MLEVKDIFKQEIIMLQLTFNPGLTLTGFRTTQPWYIWPHGKLALFILDFRLSLRNKFERVKNYSNYYYCMLKMTKMMAQQVRVNVGY